MSRNRVLFNTLGLFAGPANSTGYLFSSGNSGVNLVTQLQRVQSVSDDWTNTLVDIKQLGELGDVDRINVEPPSVNLSFDWLLADVSNEKKIGLYISGDQPAIKFIADKTNDDRNFFLAVAPEGVDVRGWTGNCQVFQFTNAYLSSYSSEGSVGAVPTASASFECLNWATSTGSTNTPLKAIVPTGGQLVQGVNFTIPVGVSGIAPTVSALRPGGLTVDIGNGTLGIAASDLKIQSYSFNLETPRVNLNKAGSFYPYAKDIQPPLNCSISVTAYYGDLVESNLQNLVCENPNYDVTINLNDPACTGYGATAVKYVGKRMKLDSENFSDQTVDNTAATVTLNFSVPVALQTDRGAFISGSRF
jgi:hypothetical protein